MQSLVQILFIMESTVETSTAAVAGNSTPTRSTKDLIESFYYRGWNRRDENVIFECLDADVRFRNALRVRAKKDRGPQAYLDYMRHLLTVVENYTIMLDDIVIDETGRKVAVRCTSRGVHRGSFFGVQGSGYEVSWTSMAFLTVVNGKITEIWVLGDVDSLKNQVNAEKDARAFSA